jgi:hypothetical protein
MGDVQIPALRRLHGYLATPTSSGPWPGEATGSLRSAP